MVKIGVIFHSSTGTTAQLAEAVTQGVNIVDGAAGLLIRVHDNDIHGGRYLNGALYDQLQDVDGLIFGSPTYMGNVSAQFKSFMDATSQFWKEGQWTDKLAAGFTVGGLLQGDQLSTIMAFKTFAAQHGMLWVGLDSDAPNRLGAQSGLIAQSEGASVGVMDEDLSTARYLGKRMARLATMISGRS